MGAIEPVQCVPNIALSLCRDFGDHANRIVDRKYRKYSCFETLPSPECKAICTRRHQTPEADISAAG
jgi:hypothetical protein